MSLHERIITTARPSGIATLLSVRTITWLIVVSVFAWPPIFARAEAITYSVPLLSIFGSYRWIIPYIPSAFALIMVIENYIYQRTIKFTLTNERLILHYGLFTRVQDEIELYRVVDVAQTVGIIQRMIGVGNVHVKSNDRTGNIIMPQIPDSAAMRNAVRDQAEECKSRRGSVRILE